LRLVQNGIDERIVWSDGHKVVELKIVLRAFFGAGQAFCLSRRLVSSSISEAIISSRFAYCVASLAAEACLAGLIATPAAAEVSTGISSSVATSVTACVTACISTGIATSVTAAGVSTTISAAVATTVATTVAATTVTAPAVAPATIASTAITTPAAIVKRQQAGARINAARTAKALQDRGLLRRDLGNDLVLIDPKARKLLKKSPHLLRAVRLAASLDRLGWQPNAARDLIVHGETFLSPL
jgi:hypothetical protein